jgi:hypothetical protein
LTIRAETSGTIGSVRWRIDGVTVRTENYAPYAIGGDASGGSDLLPYAFPYGTHVLEVTAFSGVNASGSSLKQLTLTFTVR